MDKIRTVRQKMICKARKEELYYLLSKVPEELESEVAAKIKQMSVQPGMQYALIRDYLRNIVQDHLDKDRND